MSNQPGQQIPSTSNAEKVEKPHDDKSKSFRKEHLGGNLGPMILNAEQIRQMGEAKSKEELKLMAEEMNNKSNKWRME